MTINTLISISVAGKTFSAELFDNPTASDLHRHLPITVTVDDFNGVEKVGPLPAALTTDGVPGGAKPEVNDLGYYAPTRGLVFYYGEVGYWPGIVRIGRIYPADMAQLRDLPGPVDVTLTGDSRYPQHSDREEPS